jgi:hypothetical protein
MSIFSIVSSLGQGLLRAEHDDLTSSSGPGAGEANAATPGAAKVMTARDVIAARRARRANRGPSKVRPNLHKMVNDFQRCHPAWQKETCLIDAYDFTGDGVFEVSPEVQEHIEEAGRGSVLIPVLLRVAVTIGGRLFITFARTEATGDAAEDYTDAFDASLTEWVWIKWSDGLYDWGSTTDPEVAASEPKWPADRTPEQIYMSMRAGRYIDEPGHHLVQRVLLGKR